MRAPLLKPNSKSRQTKNGDCSLRDVNEGSLSDETIVHPALKKYFGYCIKKLTLLMHRRLSLSLEELNICPQHYGILIILDEKNEYNQLKLGEELGFDKATMVKRIDDLEKNELVKRIPSTTDRRQKLIYITDKGKKTLERAKKVSKKLEEELMSFVSKEEEATLRKSIPHLLEKLLENIK